MPTPRITPAKYVRRLAESIRLSASTFPQPLSQALLIEICSSRQYESPRSYKSIIPNGQRCPESAAAGFDETLAGVGAVDVAGVAQFVVFEHLRVVVEMVGEVDIIVIPEGNRVEGAELSSEIEHAVVFFDDAGFAGACRNYGPVVVTLFGKDAEIIVDQ